MEGEGIKKTKLTFAIHNLPGALLVRVGQYLEIKECFDTARCCKTSSLMPILDSITEVWVQEGRHKENTRAQVSSLMMCPRLQCLQVIASPGTIKPLLTSSSIALSLKRLQFFEMVEEGVLDLAYVLPSFKSLQECLISFNSDAPPGIASLKLLLVALPRSLCSLRLLSDLPEEVLPDLAMSIANGSLPSLRELGLSLEIGDEKYADCLRNAFKTPGASKLTDLHLDISWHLFPRILGPLEGDVTSILPGLKNLELGYLEDWASLGHYLLQKEWLPQLEAITFNFEFELWYEYTIEVTQLYFSIARLRNIGIFNGILRTGDLEQDLFRELLIGISQPLHPNIMSNISDLDLRGSYMVDYEMRCLASAIESRNLSYIDELQVDFHKSSDIESFRTLGRFLNNDFLPNLSTLSLGEEVADSVGVSHWQAFFSGIAASAGGLRKLDCLDVEREDGGPTSCGNVFHALLNLPSPKIFTSLGMLRIYGSTTGRDLQIASFLLMSGEFPSLKELEFDEPLPCNSEDSRCAVRLLFCVLSNRKHFKSLTLRGHYDRVNYLQLIDIFLSCIFESSLVFPYLERVLIGECDTEGIHVEVVLYLQGRFNQVRELGGLTRLRFLCLKGREILIE